jgi:Nif-specific ferredoxin III
MPTITGTNRGGKPWTPKFIDAIEIDKCIGCGRCYKVCGFDVLELIEKPFAGEDEYGDDMGNKVMSVARPRTASMRVRRAPAKCHVHVASKSKHQLPTKFK